ncbi:MAG TPA: hypothetical protein VK927_11915 [Adhaeribacter sp.]|nr:hypothetical protein [Adhaeribacter sp.]
MDLNFDQARSKHMFFKTRVRGYLLGSEANTNAFQVYLTELGEWVNKLATQYKLDLAEVLEANYLHNELADKTNKLIKLQSSGKEDEAREQFNQIESTGEKFLNTLSSLEKQLKNR